jgi:hypothetical protein
MDISFGAIVLLLLNLAIPAALMGVMNPIYMPRVKVFAIVSAVVSLTAYLAMRLWPVTVFLILVSRIGINPCAIVFLYAPVAQLRI